MGSGQVASFLGAEPSHRDREADVLLCADAAAEGLNFQFCGALVNYKTPASLRAGLTGYFQFYNGRRRHSSLGRRTPDVVYFDATSFGTAA